MTYKFLSLLEVCGHGTVVMDNDCWSILIYLWDAWRLGVDVGYLDMSEITGLRFEQLCVVLPRMQEAGFIKIIDGCYSLTFSGIWVIFNRERFLKGF